MSSIDSSNRFGERAEEQALHKVREALSKLPAWLPQPALVIASVANLDPAVVKAKLFVLQSRGVGRVEFQVLDARGQPAETFERQRDLPRVVLDDFGNEIEVTPQNTELVFRQAPAEDTSTRKQEDGEAPAKRPSGPPKVNPGPAKPRLVKRISQKLERVEDPEYCEVRQRIHLCEVDQQRTEGNRGLDKTFDTYARLRGWRLVAAWLALAVFLTLVITGLLAVYQLVPVNEAIFQTMFGTLVPSQLVLVLLAYFFGRRVPHCPSKGALGGMSALLGS